MKIYAISDTHFSHNKLIEWGRPATFGEDILKNLSHVHGDVLIHCGDFCIGNDESNLQAFMQATQGFAHKILVRGNHDHKSDGYYLSHGFDFVCESFTATYFGKKVLFTHIPTAHKLESIDFNVHGHLHGNTHRLTPELSAVYDTSFYKDLAPDIHNYKPVDLERLLCTVQKETLA